MQEENIILEILPIIALVLALALIFIMIKDKQKLKALRSANIRIGRKSTKLLTPRVRLLFKPLFGQGTQQFYLTKEGGNTVEVTGALYLLSQNTLRDEHGRMTREDTAVVINWRSGRFVAFRSGGFDPNVSLLSCLSFKAWTKIARPSMALVWIMMIGSVVYNLLLLISMSEGYEPTFLYEPSMGGWYVAFFVVIAAYFIRQAAQDGFFAHAWVKNVTHEDILLEKPSNQNANKDPDVLQKLHVDVYDVDFFYHDNVAAGDYLKTITLEELSKSIDQAQKRRVAELSAEVTNLQTHLGQLQSLYEIKQAENNELKESIEIVRSTGVAEGIKLANQTLNFATFQTSSMNPEKIWSLLKVSVPTIVVGLVLVNIVPVLLDFFSNLSLDPSVAWMVLIGLGIVLLCAFAIILLILREIIRGGMRIT